MPLPPPPRTLALRVLRYMRVEKGEARPTLLLASYLMLGMATVICLKAVSDAVFLSAFDAKRLPWVDLIVTLQVGLVANIYLRLSAKMPISRLIGASQAFLALNLFVYWILLRMEVPSVPAIIYVFVGVFAVLIPSQVWSLASAVFNTRQAKRLFSLIGSGGIIGAGLGGSFAGLLGPVIGTEQLLLATVVLVGATALIADALTRSKRAAAAAASGTGAKRASLTESLRLVRGSRYLTLIATVILLSTIASTLVKYEFKATAQVFFDSDRDALASFAGYFYGYIAVISFLIHTLFTGKLLRKAGLGWSLFVLPLFLLGGVSALFVSSALWAAVLARGSDQGFRHSVDRASMELLYMPVQPAVRARVKSFLDMVTGRVGDGFASILLLGVVTMWGGGKAVVLTAAVILMVWLAALWRLREEYVTTLRGTIERKDLGSEELIRNLAEAGPSRELDAMLESPEQGDVEASIGWIQLSGARAGQAHLASLLKHPTAAVRRKAMRAVASAGLEGCEQEALGFLEMEDDAEARWTAIEYITGQGEHGALEVFLDSPDRRLGAQAAAGLMGVDTPLRERAEVVFSEWLEEAAAGSSEQRAAAARLLGAAPNSSAAGRLLVGLLADSDIEVRRAALKSAVAIKPREAIDQILDLLADPRAATESRAAIEALGRPALVALAARMRGGRESAGWHRQALRALGKMDEKEAVAALLEYLAQPDAAARREALRALGGLRRRHPRMVLPGPEVERLLRSSLRRYYLLVSLAEGAKGEGSEAARFLLRSLRERIKRRREEAFLLLGLIYPQKEMLDAFYWIESGRSDLRSNALEFLDSRLIGSPLRPLVLPAVENGGGLPAIEAGRELFGLESLPYGGVLRRLLEGSDHWLQACACLAAAESGVVELLASIERLQSHTDEVVRESAEASTRRLAAQQ